MKHIILNKSADYPRDDGYGRYYFTFNDPDNTKIEVDKEKFDNYQVGDFYDVEFPPSFLESVIEIKNKEIQKLFDKIEALKLHNHVLIVANEDLDKDLNDVREVFQTAMELAKKYKDERDEYKIGHDRYEKLRRLHLHEIKELYLKNLRSGGRLDKLVDQL